jgi:glycosyltransferase involved in cell wall biosynthesis
MERSNNIVLSIITPCYNHGIYLDEMLESVHSYTWPFAIEHIIINDGSTDTFTNQKIKKLEGQKNVIIINQENKGLGAARNVAITASKGKYILPLDADNKIHPDVVCKGVELMEKDSSISVVYGTAEYFGERQGLWKSEAFDIVKLMTKNYIDACALYKKEVWINNKGYDENMPFMGYEDWDFWLNAAFKGCHFYSMNEIMFDYRVLGSSMIRSFNADKANQNVKYIVCKYAEYYIDYLARYHHATNLIFEKKSLRSFGKLILGSIGLFKPKI